MKKRGMYALALFSLLPVIVGTACGGSGDAPQGPASTQPASSGYDPVADAQFEAELSAFIGPRVGSAEYAAKFIAEQDAVRGTYNGMDYSQKVQALNSFLISPNNEARPIAELAAQEIAGKMISEDFGVAFSPAPVAFEFNTLSRLDCGKDVNVAYGNLYPHIDSSEMAQINQIASKYGYTCQMESNTAGLDGAEISTVMADPSNIGRTLWFLGHEKGHDASGSDGRLIPYGPNGTLSGEETFMDMYGPWFAGRYLRENPELMQYVGPSLEKQLAENPALPISLSASISNPHFDQTYRDYQVMDAVNCLRASGNWATAFSIMSGVEDQAGLDAAKAQYCAPAPTAEPRPTTDPTLYTQGAATYYSVVSGLKPWGPDSYGAACVPANGLGTMDIANKALSSNGGGEPATGADNIDYLIRTGGNSCGAGYYTVPDTNGDGLVGVAP